MTYSEATEDLWELLQKNGYVWDIYWNGYLNEKTKLFIGHSAVLLWPGDIRDYLLTGFIRNINIFDFGPVKTTPEMLGMRKHSDGRAVNIRRVK